MMNFCVLRINGRVSRLLAPLVAVGVAGWFAACKPAEEPPPPPKVEVYPVLADKIAASFEYIAQALAYDEVDLVARVGGFIEERGFESGDMVKEGQLLFKIERAPYESKVEAAKAVVAQKQAAVELAEIEHHRQKTLFEKNAVSKDKLDNAVADLRTAEANLRNAEAQLVQEDLNLGYTMVTAPFAGKIGNYNYSVGGMVVPESKSLANLARIEPMKVRFHVSETEMADAIERRGHDVGQAFVPWLTMPNGTSYPHPGRLLFMDNRVNPRTGTIMIQAEFQNPDYFLLPGQYLRLTLKSRELQAVLLAPQTAMQQDQGGTYAMVVKDDSTVERRPVEVGRQYGEFIVVEKGLKEGDRLVVQGLQRVRPGVKVQAAVAEIAKPRTDATDAASLPPPPPSAQGENPAAPPPSPQAGKPAEGEAPPASPTSPAPESPQAKPSDPAAPAAAPPAAPAPVAEPVPAASAPAAEPASVKEEAAADVQ